MNIKYPTGVYISVKLDIDTEEKIYEYIDKHLNNFTRNNKLHCTLIYSSEKCNEIIAISEETEFKASFKNFSAFGENKDIIVMEIESDELKKRNKELVTKYGFISDFDEYKPHITLSYVNEDLDISSEDIKEVVDNLPPINFPIILINETVEALNIDWVSNENVSREQEWNHKDFVMAPLIESKNGYNLYKVGDYNYLTDNEKNYLGYINIVNNTISEDYKDILVEMVYNN